MSEPLISIVIPIYNVESYLKKCLDTVIHQTYKNLQIILVDDGSLDSSGSICDEYASMDGRVVVVHRKNGGLSAARNSGVEIVKGEYILFVDSDDYIAVDMVEILYKYLQEYQCDIAVCSYHIFLGDENTENLKCESPVIVVQSQREVYERLGVKNLYQWYEPQVWNKLYRTEIIRDIRFEEGKYCEDQFYCHLSYEKAKKIVFTNEELYFYRNRKDSISGTFSVKMLDAVEGMERRIQFAKNKSQKKLENNTCAAMLDLLMRYWYESYQMKDMEMAKTIHTKFKEYLLLYNIYKRNYSKGKCLKYKVFAHAPLLCKTLLKLV